MSYVPVPRSLASEVLVLPDLYSLEWTMDELPKDKLNTVTEMDPQSHVGAQRTEWTLP